VKRIVVDVLVAGAGDDVGAGIGDILGASMMAMMG